MGDVTPPMASWMMSPWQWRHGNSVACQSKCKCTLQGNVIANATLLSEWAGESQTGNPIGSELVHQNTNTAIYSYRRTLIWRPPTGVSKSGLYIYSKAVFTSRWQNDQIMLKFPALLGSETCSGMKIVSENFGPTMVQTNWIDPTRRNISENTGSPILIPQKYLSPDL